MTRALGIGMLLVSAAACSGDGLTGPAALDCGTGPYFQVLPFDIAEIDHINVIGSLGAPGHTLPTPHTSFNVKRVGTPVAAPADMQITGLRRGRFLVSPRRQGTETLTIDFSLCRQVSGWFGHLTSLAPAVVSGVSWGNCQTYSTAQETIESCTAEPRKLQVRAGDALGTAGEDLEQGFMALDFGLIDSRVNHAYVSPWRFPSHLRQAICPWDQFPAAVRTQLYALLRDPSRPSMTPAGEPRCGTLQVDVPGTAKGVWADPAETQPVAGNETRYATLANYPFRPQDMLALSLGPNELGAMVGVVPRATTGRVNRAFEHVLPDGTIYCYGPDDHFPERSWLLALTTTSALTIRFITHTPGSSPCLADPTTWSTAGGLNLVR